MSYFQAFGENVHLFVGAIMLLATTLEVSADHQTIFIASRGKPAAIYSCQLNTVTGEFGEIKVAADVRTGFMALHPNKPLLYAATSEQPVDPQAPNGGVRVYRVNSDSMTLELLQTASTKDRGTTHIEVSKQGSVALVCHYGGAGTSALGIAEDGKLTDQFSQVRHEGSSAHPQRQTRPHPHGVAIAADGRFVCVADLGNDHVEVFSISAAAKLGQASRWKAKPGAGPRHVTYHPNGKWLYCINELDSTISVLAYDAATGELSEIETVSTLPDGYSRPNSTAEVVVHPSGQFLYGSNRGHNSTAVFAIDQKSGKLSFVEREPTQGDHPRFVGVDPTGKIYIAANMNENNLVSFKIDPRTGKLAPTGHQLAVQRPMCVVFAK